MQAQAPPPASPGELQAHITGTYLDQRLGIAALAFAFPLLLAGGGRLLYGLPLQPSLSAYYHTEMRNVFVGVLFAVGAFLYLYKGFSRQEDLVLDAAGVLAIAIALLPNRRRGDPPRLAATLHGVAAVLFFVCIAYVCLFRASDTLPLVGDGRRAERYDRLYRLLGGLMLLAPASAWLLTEVLQHGVRERSYVFFAELVGVWTFAAYWMAKGLEIVHTQAERRIADRELARDDRGNVVPREVCP